MLTISNKTLDGGAVKTALAQADRVLHGFLHPEKKAAASALEELMEEADMPAAAAPAPAAAPAQ